MQVDNSPVPPPCFSFPNTVLQELKTSAKHYGGGDELALLYGLFRLAK
ncbi:unnamed protein product [Pylaiella littoralis]